MNIIFGKTRQGMLGMLYPANKKGFTALTGVYKRTQRVFRKDYFFF